MAAFARGPDITARLCDVIECLEGDAVQEHAELNATALLKELNRLLTSSQAGTDHGKLEALIRHVRAGPRRDPERRSRACPEAVQRGAGRLDEAGKSH